MLFKAIVHASVLVTGSGVRKKNGRRIQDGDLDEILDGAMVYSVKKIGEKEIPDKIKWIGPTSEIPSEYDHVERVDLEGASTVIPGMIDCHTHMIFSGDRSKEFALRCSGVSYQEIAKKGGGILTTVVSTREASFSDLEDLAIQRVRESAGFGVKTIEIKSGYGLNTETEIKCLKVAQKLKDVFPEINFQVTFLGAHAIPHDCDRREYINEILNVMLPRVSREKLADACDVFVDQGYFTLSEAKEILSKAKELQLKIKIHGDELVNTESAKFACEMNALSVDHLLQVSESGIKALSESETVAVLLPGTAFYLKTGYAPARRLIDAGACVALSTDFNPGSSMCNNLPAILTLSALYMNMTRAEVFAGVTYNAAKALGLEKNKGTLETGFDADFTILPFKTFEEAYYCFAWSSFGSR